jgi:hypothetical protein
MTQHEKSARTWKTWHVLAAAGFMLVIGIAVGASTGDVTDDAAVAAPAAPETEPPTTPTAEATVTPTAQATTPSPSPDRTLPPAARERVFAQVFEDSRLDFAEAIESDFGPSDVDSVDAFTYDADSKLIRLAVTSAYNGEDIRRDVAWAITRAMAGLYAPDGLTGSTGVAPDFELSVGFGVDYRCTGEFMLQLVDRQVTRDVWDSDCRL